MTDQVARIQTKLDTLIGRDRGHSVFGAGSSHGHKYRRRPVLSEDSLRDLESNLQVALPAEASEFLRQVHAGGPGPGYGLFLEPDLSTLARRAKPFPFDTAKTRSLIHRRLSGGDSRWATLAAEGDDSEDDDDWPPGPGFVPIAHHGCGVFDVLVLTGEQRGFIWWHDSGWAPHHDETGRQYAFLDWYELWLDRSLREVANAPLLRRSLLGRWFR